MVPKIFIIMNSILISCGFGHALETTRWYRDNDDTRILSSHQQQPAEKGTINTEPRILGGEKASIKKFPWMASVCIVNSDKEKESLYFFAGASLITKRHLLTAAHVVNSHTKNPKGMAVTMGSKYRCNGSRFDIKKAYVHPEYKENHTDLGIIELVTTVHFTDEMKPIKLPKRIENYEGRMLTTIGWGFTSTNESDTDVLMELKIHIRSTETCQKYHTNYLPEELICGGDPNGTCEGDSGGPLMVKKGGKFVIVGVTAFGVEKICGHALPSYFTNVTTYLDWIKDKIL